MDPEALAVFARHMDEIHLVLTDLMMPFMDGTTLIRTLRKMKTNVKIIASTGRTEETRLAELKSLNVPACLAKPYRTDKLLTTLREVLDGVSGASCEAEGI
jgi:CheY-like chemotaxis protein